MAKPGGPFKVDRKVSVGSRAGRYVKLWPWPYVSVGPLEFGFNGEAIAASRVYRRVFIVGPWRWAITRWRPN